MQIYVNFPKEEDGLQLLRENVSYFHAVLLKKEIDSYNFDKTSEKKIVNHILEKISKNNNNTSDKLKNR